MPRNRTYTVLLKFLVPFLVWLFFFRDFLSGRATIEGNGFDVYSVVKFYLDALRDGTFPLWNPYMQCGLPYIRHVGEYNPLLGMTLVLSLLGVGFYKAFIISTVAYYFVGLAGFYLLAKRLLGDPWIAYTAFLLLMFSSLGMSLFNQVTILLIYVPVVWFFYFLVGLAQTWHRAFFMGLVCSLVIILTTYLPLYFLTVFLLFALLLVVLYPGAVIPFFVGLLRFFRAQMLLTAVCLLLLGAGLLSSWLTYKTIDDNLTLLTRHKDSAAEQGVRIDMSTALDIGYIQGALDEGISSARLKEVGYKNERFYYVPFFCYLLLGISAWTAFNKRSVLLLSLGFILFLISLGKVTGFYEFLYTHIFYFKIFRNLHLLLAFIVSIFVLLVVQQFQLFLKQWTLTGRAKYWGLGWIAAVHLLFFIYLRGQDNVMASSYLTIWVSLAFFVVYGFRLTRLDRFPLLALLFVLIAIQPAEVLAAYHEKVFDAVGSNVISDGIQQNYRKPDFIFERPDHPRLPYDPSNENLYAWHLITRQDSAVNIPYKGGYPTRWTHFLIRNVSHDVLLPYVRYKFLLYDQVKVVREKVITPPQAVDMFRPGQTAASVLDRSPAQLSADEINSLEGQSNFSGGAFRMIESNSDSFRVVDFNVNSITVRTDLPTPQFLVYTDSYLPGWKAFVNGKETQVYRTNIAFKGLWLPAGTATVSLRYQPYGGQWFFWALLAATWILFIYTAYEFRKNACGLRK